MEENKNFNDRARDTASNFGEEAKNTANEFKENWNETTNSGNIFRTCPEVSFLSTTNN